MNQGVRVLCWNCRGALSGEFLREIREFMRKYKPEIIVLLEPRISGATADGVCRKMGMNCWIRSEAEGFSGGVWFLWNKEEVDVVPRYAHASILHVSVTSRGGPWDMTAVYASPITGK